MKWILSFVFPSWIAAAFYNFLSFLLAQLLGLFHSELLIFSSPNPKEERMIIDWRPLQTERGRCTCHSDVLAIRPRICFLISTEIQTPHGLHLSWESQQRFRELGDFIVCLQPQLLGNMLVLIPTGLASWRPPSCFGSRESELKLIQQTV